MWCAILVWLAVLCLPAAADPLPATAVLAAPSVPAREEGATLLAVRSPGRFALVAHSSSGAPLQLVDMLAGLGEVAGQAGAQDGRIDALLDAGTYKLRVFAAQHTTGDVALSVLPFRDAAPPSPMPPDGRLLSGEVGGLQQRSFWMKVPAPGNVRIAATGRALADLVLFRNGRDVARLPLVTPLVEPVHGHPMAEVVVEGRVEPGSYLVTAYGGKPAVWTDGVASMPCHIRAGFSQVLFAGWAGGAIGASGSEVFALPAWVGAVRLDLPHAAYAELIATSDAAGIDWKSREPSVALRVDAMNVAHSIELRGDAGRAFTLRGIQTKAMLPQSPGTYWMSAVRWA